MCIRGIRLHTFQHALTRTYVRTVVTKYARRFESTHARAYKVPVRVTAYAIASTIATVQMTLYTLTYSVLSVQG